jgi:hypothetical protein
MLRIWLALLVLARAGVSHTGVSHTIRPAPGMEIDYVDWCDEPKHALRGERR